MSGVSVYVARGMTGYNQAEVVENALHDRLVLEEHGIIVNCPVAAEGIKAVNRPLLSTKAQMDYYWWRDKAMIRASDVFVDCTPHLKSQGVEREAGYARYHLWKPVVRVFPEDKLPAPGNICFYEDDLIVTDIDEAAKLIKQKWGTPKKRLKWKIQIIQKSLLKYLKIRLNWFIDWR